MNGLSLNKIHGKPRSIIFQGFGLKAHHMVGFFTMVSHVSISQFSCFA